tara:strand:+ start:526 stop:885 length:360 start_codon:yes stop_codon:yes gene_type:complete
MASTRNKNTPSDYCLQQQSYRTARDWRFFDNASNSRAYKPAFAGNGVLMGHMGRDVLSTNSVDVESALFGINSTNLVNPQAPTQAHINNMCDANFIDRLPVILPEPLVVQQERPFPVPQ